MNMKNHEFDYEMYPGGISEDVYDLEPSVWDRGYYCETEEGVWYELYVNETIKSDYPTIAEDFDNIDSILKAGANVIVAGTTTFTGGEKEYANNISKLRG